MAIDKSFLASARSLSRNPLGIIALFIVLVYAVASLVISNAKAEFYQNPYHPAVIFLAVFPLIVLAVFAVLVARYHRHLYAPQDFRSDDSFNAQVPTKLRGRKTGAATSDDNSQPVSAATERSIEESYKNFVQAGFVLLHQAETLEQRTTPGSGRYRVRVWLESIEGMRSLREVESVTYHIWYNFEQPVLATTDIKSNFDLWLNVWGEFPVLALLRTKSGEQIELHRHLDLPGRPPD